MELPLDLWNQILPNGMRLGDFVKHADPYLCPVTDFAAITNIWHQRLADAVRVGRTDVKLRAERVLHFLCERNPDVVLLTWIVSRDASKEGITAFFAPSSGEFFVVGTEEDPPTHP